VSNLDSLTASALEIIVFMFANDRLFTAASCFPRLCAFGVKVEPLRGRFANLDTIMVSSPAVCDTMANYKRKSFTGVRLRKMERHDFAGF